MGVFVSWDLHRLLCSFFNPSLKTFKFSIWLWCLYIYRSCPELPISSIFWIRSSFLLPFSVWSVSLHSDWLPPKTQLCYSQVTSQHGSTTWCYAICRPMKTLFCPGQWNNLNWVLDGTISVLIIGLYFRHWVLKSVIEDILLQSCILHFGLVLHVLWFGWFSSSIILDLVLCTDWNSPSWNVENSTLGNSNVANIYSDRTNDFLLSLKFAELLCSTSTLRQ